MEDAMPKSALSLSDENPPAETRLSYDALVEALTAGIGVCLGNHRRASALLENAKRLEREASQYRLQIAAIRAAGGIRSGVRLSHLSRTLKRLEGDRDRALAEAETCLDAPVPTRG